MAKCLRRRAFEMSHVRRRREVDEDDVVTSGCSREHVRRGAGAQGDHPGIRPRKQRCEPEVRGPRAKPSGRRERELLAARCRNRRRADASGVSATTSLPPTCSRARSNRRPASRHVRNLGDRSGDARAGDSYVDDVGVRIVGSQQPGDGLFGQLCADAHTGAVAENQHRRAFALIVAARSAVRPWQSDGRGRRHARRRPSPAEPPASANEDSSKAGRRDGAQRRRGCLGAWTHPLCQGRAIGGTPRSSWPLPAIGKPAPAQRPACSSDTDACLFRLRGRPGRSPCRVSEPVRHTRRQWGDRVTRSAHLSGSARTGGTASAPLAASATMSLRHRRRLASHRRRTAGLGRRRPDGRDAGLSLPRVERRRQLCSIPADRQQATAWVCGSDYYVAEFTDDRLKARWTECKADNACRQRIDGQMQRWLPPNKARSTRVTGLVDPVGKIEPDGAVDLRAIRGPAFFAGEPYAERIAGPNREPGRWSSRCRAIRSSDSSSAWTVTSGCAAGTSRVQASTMVAARGDARSSS